MMEVNIKENFIAFIGEVLKRPAMFGTNKVEDIELMCLGYKQALYGIDKGNGQAFNDFLQDFRQYVNTHFESKSDTNWSRLIRFYSGSDQHSLELFSKLFHLYCALK